MLDRSAVEKLYAEFYDLYVADFQRDVPVYRDLVAKANGPVLEVGCATGRTLAHLAESGQEVHGIDTAREMLEIARRRMRPHRANTRVFDHDLRASALPGEYAAAIAPRHSFNWLIDIEEQRRFLRHLRQSLRSTGVVVIDCFYPLGLARPETQGEWREIERTVDGCKIVVRDRREMLTPLLERRTQVFRMDDAEPAEATTHRRYVPPYQLSQLLAEAGFEGVLWARDYDLQTAEAIEPDSRPAGPFLVIAETG